MIPRSGLVRLAARGRPFLSGPRARVAPRGRLRRVLWLAALLALLAHPVARAASDVFSNVGPASQLRGGALVDRYPLGNYALDHHFTAASASLTGGIDVSGVPALIAYFLADVVWQLTAFLASALITLFTFAFSLDLVNGSQATGGAGALAPVSTAINSIYQTTFGAPWLVVAILAAGLWAMWKALVQRRYTETAGALGLSVVFVVIALAFVTQPQRTIGKASQWTNEMSAAFLSLSSSGSVGDQQAAKQQASDQLFLLLVSQPWTVLNFGGLDHCVKTPISGSSPQSVPVRPLSANPGRDAQLSAQLSAGTQVAADGKACINNQNKYATHFLAYAPESDERNAEYDALANGDTSKLPDSDPAKHNNTYSLSPADKPAADAMGKGGQYQRLLLAIVIFLGELGAFLLLGALSVAVILAQVLVLLLLAFAPVALVIGVYPGRGHDFFRGWLSRLATFLLRKAIYSLILAVLLAVAAAVGDATSNLGWLLAFGLQGAFFWAVFLYRHQLTGQLTAATAGSGARAEEGTVRLAALYAATRLARRAVPRRHASPGPTQPATAPAQAPTAHPQTGEQLPPAGPVRPEDPAAYPPGSEQSPASTSSPAGAQQGGEPPGALALAEDPRRPAGAGPGTPARTAGSSPAQTTHRDAGEGGPPATHPILPREAAGPPARRVRPASDDLRPPVGQDLTPAPSPLPDAAERPSAPPTAASRVQVAPASAPGSPPGGLAPGTLAEQLRGDAQRLTRGPRRAAETSPQPTPQTPTKAPAPAGEDPRPAVEDRWPARPQRPERPAGGER